MDGSAVFAVVSGGTAREPRLGYLAQTVPVTAEVLALAGPEVAPGMIFRMAAPCAGAACQHFDGARCGLATRIVRRLPVVTERLPPCRIRPSCRWWAQEGPAACQRCPQIVSQTVEPSEALRAAADPNTPLREREL
jgi:hypothetical protein